MTCSWQRQRCCCQHRQLSSRSQLQRWHVLACGAVSCSSAYGKPDRSEREQVGISSVGAVSLCDSRRARAPKLDRCTAESEAPTEGEKPKYDSVGELVTLPSGTSETSDVPCITDASELRRGTGSLRPQTCSAGIQYREMETGAGREVTAHLIQ